MTRKAPTAIALVALLGLPVNVLGGTIPSGKADAYSSRLDLAGGDGTGFVLKQIRWGDQRSFERVVFEFAPSGSVQGAFPRIRAASEEYPSRLSIEAEGAARAEERLFVSSHPLAKSRLLSGVDTYDLCALGQGAAIVPARPVEYEVFWLRNPPRLVVDLRPAAESPPERERFSVRTDVLMGDQACIFIEEARALGLSPRLLNDSKGQTFGEAGIYDTVEEAFGARAGLGALSSRFSLTVKKRGVMGVPEPLP